MYEISFIEFLLAVLLISVAVILSVDYVLSRYFHYKLLYNSRVIDALKPETQDGIEDKRQ